MAQKNQTRMAIDFLSLVGTFWLKVVYNHMKYTFVAAVLEIPRENIAVLCQSPDRPNIFTQLRLSKTPVDIM